MGVTMLWRKKPKDQPNNRPDTSEDDAKYRWNNSKWSVPSYEHWYAGNSDYQTDERNYWWHQVWALCHHPQRMAQFIVAQYTPPLYSPI
jgi:hypothetical protein